MRSLVPAALLVLLVLPARAAPDEKDARFRELSRSYREVQKSAQWEEIKKRRDLIVALGSLDHPGVVPLLYEAFTEDREDVCRVPAMIGCGKRAPFAVLKAMVTAAVRDRNEIYRMLLPLAFAGSKDEKIGPWLVRNFLPEKRDIVLRAATIESVGLLRCPDALAILREVLRGDERDSRIRYESILALSRIGGPQVFDEVVPFLGSDDREIREGAVLALAETGDPRAAAKFLPLAKDPCPLVEEAVAEVLRRGKSEAGLPALVEMLRTGRLRVMDAARAALEEVTGQKLGVDAGAWEKWLADRTAPVPAPGEGPSSVATYYGMKVFSDRVLFVIDVSGSMKAGSPARIDTAREELKKVVGELNRKTLFNVVAFSGTPVFWQKSEVEATPENVASARVFADGLMAGGGTDAYDTLAEAFTKNRETDTIYFLGDGSPSLGTYTEQEEILARIRWMNRMRKIRIHCIALLRGKVGHFGGRMGPGIGRGRSISDERAYDEDEAARFLARLAAEHGGSFVKIDR